jgi:hypothetical protein
VPSIQVHFVHGDFPDLGGAFTQRLDGLAGGDHAAMDDEKVPRLPSVMSLWPSDDVSATITRTCS